MCVAEGCVEVVSYESVEVVGAGFVCSEACEAAVLAA